MNCMVFDYSIFCLLFFQIIKIANLSNTVPVINTNVNRFKEIHTCTEINEYVLTMYNVFTNAFRCQSLYQFLAGSRKFSQGWDSDGYVLFAGGGGQGGGGSKPWPNTLIRNIAIRLNFPGIRGNPTTSLTTDIYAQICEWILEFCLEKSCMFKKINLIYFIVSNHDSESAQLPSTKKIIHIGRGLRRCTYFVFFVKKVEQSGFVLQ